MVEMLIISLLVLWSALVVFKKVFPKTSFKFFSALANALQNKGYVKVANWLRPANAVGCGGSCGCSQNETENEQKTTVQTVKWK